MSGAGWSERRLHFVAAGGAGMSGLALVCHRLGATVTGTDRADSSYLQRLRDAGLDVRVGHDADAVDPTAELVVSTAIGPENPELVRARERDQTIHHRSDLLAELCASKRLIAVAGAHGKTTTTAMLTHALRRAGADPAFFIGGELPGAGPGGAATNAGWAEGEWVVAEADESDASFLKLQPEVAVVTNIELDHHSHWGGLTELTGAFERFAQPARAVVLGPEVDGRIASSSHQCLRVRGEVAEPTGTPGVLGATALSFDDGWSFTVTSPAGDVTGVRLPVPGRHNVLNALSALAAVHAAGLDLEAAAAGLADFPGVARRLEFKGRRNGAGIYDDYAHHPTEVAAALAALREITPGRLLAVFQPHLYSRTRSLAREFGEALASADEVFVLDVYPAREHPVGDLAGISGLMVAEAAADHAGGRPVWWVGDHDGATDAAAGALGPGDTLATLGAGDVHTVGEMLVEAATTPSA